MDTKEFDERNFAKSRAACEKMAKALHKERIRETWRLYKDELIELLDECGSVENIRKRLMPEGMEWPRFDDGEPVMFGDEFLISGKPQKVEFVQFFDTGLFIQSDDYDRHFSYGEPVKRAKPEPPDSWERLEEDCTISERVYYATRIGHDVGLMDDAEIHEAVSRDLVRRAKSLAEMERR